MARPYPERVAGEPGPWSSDGGVFTFTYTPDFAVKAPTVIALPAGTFTATCEHCTATLLEGRVELVPEANASSVTVTVQ